MWIGSICLPDSINLSVHKLFGKDFYFFILESFIEYRVGTNLNEMIDKYMSDMFGPWQYICFVNFSKEWSFHYSIYKDSMPQIFQDFDVPSSLMMNIFKCSKIGIICLWLIISAGLCHKSKKRIKYTNMAEQQLLLLQLLKIPVFVIRYLAKALAILTYLPNYLFLFVIDHFLFADQYSSSLVVYSLMWLPKVGLLFLALLLFCGQFYLIFAFLQLQEHGLAVQISGLILALAGLLILMRKGYLSLIEKYNLSRLKSVKQHLQLGFSFFIDLLGILLTMINVLMLVKMRQLFAYEYRQFDLDFRYLKFVFKLVRESCIVYVEFFYVQIFFRCFPWRFAKEQQPKAYAQCYGLNSLFRNTMGSNLHKRQAPQSRCLPLGNEQPKYFKQMIC